ncbi:MAG TPA: response regulator, partial [Chloroflexia bacterium]|nr:response regulator [Chloroflexia bacterium]
FDRDRLVSTLQHLTRAATGPPCVLIVDDVPALREMLATLLREAGYQVATAPDGVAALEQIGAQPPDLLLLDLLLPRLDGFAVLEWVRAHASPAIREVPIVLITAHDSTPEERAQLASATQDLIPKVGMSIGELLRVVKETLEKLHVTPLDNHPPGAAR